MKKRKVIAIGLDAADPDLVENWIAQGYLSNLNQLKSQGVSGRLTNVEYYRAETPWTTFLTGCFPEKTVLLQKVIKYRITLWLSDFLDSNPKERFDKVLLSYNIFLLDSVYLSFIDHVHYFNSPNRPPSGVKRLIS